jgi:hypothetical protein
VCCVALEWSLPNAAWLRNRKDLRRAGGFRFEGGGGYTPDFRRTYEHAPHIKLERAIEQVRVRQIVSCGAHSLGVSRELCVYAVCTIICHPPPPLLGRPRRASSPRRQNGGRGAGMRHFVDNMPEEGAAVSGDPLQAAGQ